MDYALTPMACTVGLCHPLCDDKEIQEGRDVIAGREHDAVVAWRRSQLVRAGFPTPLAARVAVDDGYDLHRLMALVKTGCPPELAVRILAPVEDRVAA